MIQKPVSRPSAAAFAFVALAAALWLAPLRGVHAAVTVPNFPADSKPGCIRRGLEKVEQEPDAYFDNVKGGYAKLKLAEKILADDAKSAHPQFTPIQFSKLETPEGTVTVIEARTVRIGNLTIELKPFQYRSPFTHDELKVLYKQAVKQAHGSGEKIHEAMSKLVDEALTIKFGLASGKMLGTGATRVNSIHPEKTGMLRRVFKGFTIEKGQLKILSDENILKNMQRDQLNEDLTYAIAKSREARGHDPIWTPIRTDWGDALDSALARAGVFEVARAPGIDVWDMLEKRQIPVELHRRLVMAKKVRDAYDPHLMAAHQGIYARIQANHDLEIEGATFPVGFDPNSGANYLSDGVHLYVVDH